MFGTVRPILRNLLASIPFGLETALLFRQALLPLPPSLQPGKTFSSWLKELRGCEPLFPHQEGQEGPLLFFSSTPQWRGISLATAVVLSVRKSPVDFVFLPYSRADQEDLPSDAITFKTLTGRHLKNGLGGPLRLIDLTTVRPVPETDQMREISREEALLDTKVVLKKEEVDLEGNPEHKRVFAFRLKRNLQVLTQLVSLMEQTSYRGFLTHNGGSLEWGAAFQLAKRRGLPSVSFECGDHLGSIWISHGIPSSSIDTSEAWQEDEPHILSEEALAKVERIMALREGVEWKDFWWSVQRVGRSLDKEKLLAQLGIEEDRRPIVLLCSNIPWDSAMLGHDTLFPSLAAWIRKTLTFFSRRCDCWLIIRIHPGERIIGTGQPVLEIIREHLPQIPPHIRIIAPEAPINSYDLMELCHFGLTYTSITGLEMAMRGIPVVVAACPHYSRKGFTLDANSLEEYGALMERLLSQPEKPRLSRREKELAWSYSHVFYFKWAKPFPWSLRTFWRDIERWPIPKVLSSEGWERFGRSFDLLVGRS